MFYEAKIKYLSGDGKVKKDTALFLCEFFAEAEHVAHELYKDFDESDVFAIKRSSIKEIVNENDADIEKSFVLTLKSVFVDENTGKQKFTTYNVLIFAEDIDSAKKIADDYIKQGLEDLIFVGIKESPIVSYTVA